MRAKSLNRGLVRTVQLTTVKSDKEGEEEEGEEKSTLNECIMILLIIIILIIIFDIYSYILIMATEHLHECIHAQAQDTQIHTRGTKMLIYAIFFFC